MTPKTPIPNNSARRRIAAALAGVLPCLEFWTWASPPDPVPAVSTAPIGGVHSRAAAEKPSAAKRGDSVEVQEMAFATGISSMTPVGRGDSFDPSVGTVYFWNRLTVRNPPARIKHAWYRDGVKVEEFVMTLHHAHSRAWTHKRIQPGQWRVDILDEDGAPIASAAFPVRPGPAQ